MNTQQDIQRIIDEEYNELSVEERKELYELYFNPETLQEQKQTLERIIFKKKPPTPEEYLEAKNGWLTENILVSTFDCIKENIKDILDPINIKNMIVKYGSTRQGKCEGKDTPILMYDLSIKKIQDIQVGDLLMGDDSTPRKVLKLYVGYGDLYKVHQNKADDYIVNENHILTLQHTNKGLRKDRNNAIDKNNGKIIDIPIKEYLSLSKNVKHRLKGIKAKLDFPFQEIKVDPYFLGLWLGDGNSHNTGITNIDKEIIDYVYEYAKTLNLSVTINKSTSSLVCTYTIVCSNNRGNQFVRGGNTLLNWLKYDCNVINNKHIPIDYIRNSEEIRLQLLAGLIDSDGYMSPDESIISISQKNKKLIEDIVFLCRSLGFRANYSKHKKTIKKLNFEGEYYQINISGDLYKIPCKLSRKKVNKTTTRFNPLRTGIKVEYIGQGDYYGFELDGNHRYLHSDLTITHNTYEARLIILYIIIFIHHLREPAMYYGLSPLTRLCIYMISFNFDSTRKLYLEPLYEIMRQSPKFKQILKQDDVRKKQRELGSDIIVWSKAATTGEITLASGLQIQLGNKDPNTIIGSDILSCFVSEISYWVEDDGASEEKIFELYSNAYTRIRNTVKQQYLAFVYLDSSANNAESIIENHIIKELSKKERTHFSWKSLWEARPDLAPIWRRTGETFTVITGNGSIPAQIVNNEIQLENVPKDLIIQVPIDFYDDFKTSLVKNIKDIAGRPTQAENKFITDGSYITNIFNNPTLVNIEGQLLADAASKPEKQIWNQVYDKLFFKNAHGKYSIRRAPKESRVIGIDLAHSAKGDLSSLCVLHKEWSKEKKQVVYVVDCTLVLVPGDKGISLEAPIYFILDLMREGSVGIKGIFVDTFQSATLVQHLERNRLDAIKQSVDTSIEPYQYLLTCLANEQIKMGRNIFIKNNLSGLVLTRSGKEKKGKEKIDHIIGTTNNKYFGDWETSTCGIYAKDASDALCQAVYGASNFDYRPVTEYESENYRLSANEKDKKDLIESLIYTKNFY